MLLTRALIAPIALSLTLPFAASAQQEEVLDLTDFVRERCDLVELFAPPPAGWFTMQVEDLPEGLAGCMMMLLDENQEDIGILHLLSASRAVEKYSGPDTSALASLELQYVGAMGYTTGEVLWSKDSVPVSSEGFEPGRAIGVSASLQGDPIRYEVHLLAFQNAAVQYVVTLLTPSKADAPDHYQRNTTDFGALIRSFQFTQP